MEVWSLFANRSATGGYGDSLQLPQQRPGRGDISDASDSQPPDQLDLPDSPPSSGSGRSRCSINNEWRGAGARPTLHLTPTSAAAAGVGGAAAGPSPGSGVSFVAVIKPTDMQVRAGSGMG